MKKVMSLVLMIIIAFGAFDFSAFSSDAITIKKNEPIEICDSNNKPVHNFGKSCQIEHNPTKESNIFKNWFLSLVQKIIDMIQFSSLVALIEKIKMKVFIFFDELLKK